MKGRKCSLIFMRKVTNRLNELEERYKDVEPEQERRRRINDDLKEIFCVGIDQIKEWKRIVKVATKCGDIPTLYPSHYPEIARLPEDKQEEIIKEVQEKNLTVKETRFVVDRILAKPSPPLPQEVLDVVYADPPWRYEVNFLSASPDSHYETLTTDEIIAKEPNISENAILFLWSTNPMLEEALKVMRAWGFIYKTNIVWVKDRIGLGFYVRGQHELLLIGTKGKAYPPEESARVSSVLDAPTQEHSKKPTQVYELIEKMYPDSKRGDLFTRERREGWISWGNEI